MNERLRSNNQRTTVKLTVAVIVCLVFFILVARSMFAATASDDRPVNFVFLVDVSGSMLSRATMVKAKDGSQVTLFEALREALRQIANDDRLLGKSSKLSVITFGTVVNEKSSWPNSVQTTEDRQRLLNLISSNEELQADKHGDTYMGGALHTAYEKAKQLQSSSEPCATTFVIMLTDGWDEPPKNAAYRVRDEANILLAKKRELRAKLGFDPWPVRVIGLQRLPERKSGTTTAKEVATILGGQFIDVSSQQNGTVSERIFLALKKAVDEQKGKIIFPSDFKLVDFGKAASEGGATAKIPVRLDSCYPEDVTGVVDETGKAGKAAGAAPSGAMTFALTQPAFTLNPHPPDTAGTQGGDNAEEITVKATVHNSCPAGSFKGVLRLTSTAKVAGSLPYVIKVPARIIAEPEEIRLEGKKSGFLSAEGFAVPLKFSLKEATGSHAHANLKVTVTPEAAVLRNGNANEPEHVAALSFNNGKSLSSDWNTENNNSVDFTVPAQIAADQAPGHYEGKLTLALDGLTGELIAPATIPFTLIIKPSPWEEVAPIAVPILVICALAVAFAIFLWLTNIRRDGTE